MRALLFTKGYDQCPSKFFVREFPANICVNSVHDVGVPQQLPPSRRTPSSTNVLTFERTGNRTFVSPDGPLPACTYCNGQCTLALTSAETLETCKKGFVSFYVCTGVSCMCIVCITIYVCMCIYMYIHVYLACVCTCTCMYAYVYFVYNNLCMYIYVYIQVYTCISCMCMYMYVCMHRYVHVHV